MIFATYEHGGSVKFGLVSQRHNAVLDLMSTAQRFDKAFVRNGQPVATLSDAINMGSHFVDVAQEFSTAFDRGEMGADITPLGEIRLRAPILRPQKNIFCVGLNYIDHIKEGDKAQKIERSAPEVPQFFTKPATTVIGPDDIIPDHSPLTNNLDYEGEIAVVIGRQGTDISPEEANSHIFGFSIINDVSARDLQRKHGQWFKGKALDGLCPFGPWIVHVSSLPNFGDLGIQTRVNGEVRQDSRTSSMIFDIPTIIAELSRGLTLEPGDVIATGTPSGVGYAMTPPRFLQAGDIIEVEVEGLGVLRNSVGR